MLEDFKSVWPFWEVTDLNKLPGENIACLECNPKYSYNEISFFSPGDD